MSMFGVIVSGRLVQGDFQQVGETQFLTVIPEADNINHIVVFLTGVQPFPDGMGGLVYFSWPDPTGPPSWQLLGYISNQKPSAIFKISKLKSVIGGGIGANGIGFGQTQISHNAQIGISIEPLINIEQQTPVLSNDASAVASYLDFTQKMLENLFNYASSFAVTQAQMTPNPTETFIPLSTLQTWYSNFQRRLQQNPNFWRN